MFSCAQLLELYSLEIQMHTEKKDNKKLRATYEQAIKVCLSLLFSPPLALSLALSLAHVHIHCFKFCPPRTNTYPIRRSHPLSLNVLCARMHVYLLCQCARMNACMGISGCCGVASISTLPKLLGLFRSSALSL